MPLAIRDMIAWLRGDVPPVADTVDVLLGPHDPDAPVSGAAVAFMPSIEAVERAAALGANLLIAHEGLYYSHRTPDRLPEGDPVYAFKQDLLRRSGVAVYRHHDYCHRAAPDPITLGMVRALGWKAELQRMLPAAAVLAVPAMRADEAAAHVKARLGLSGVRFAGDAAALCRRVGVLAGYRGGGGLAIPLLREERLDLIVAGEGPEWETPEYVRDAVHLGAAKAMLFIGHAESEAPGMRLVAERLRMAFPGLPVHWLDGDPALRYL
ncbi:Nif3-like dinuclear metal center hexameric protein [Cohnella hashimotonis]|uniref:GTP cyclohydrolase 1 type 2 homolog n=1 Tax=Cohnella hashimotonis TaxID=2826895 RepID=A0ABT6TLT9_9BACL|nr:Nif3-like dinuclear metal center hexameric protein [Cohnella hashimotonis]MDI4647809.1 Nif3-like dinuclear metal center hexameric protein [Cohnella hashimotonis]